jgi:hypothetical protein
MLKTLIQRRRISALHERFLLAKEEIRSTYCGERLRLALSMTDDKFYNDKREILEWSPYAFMKHWHLFKLRIREKYWVWRSNKLHDWVKYNTSGLLYGRTVHSNNYNGVVTGDHDVQRKVDAFYVKYDKAIAAIINARLYPNSRKK